MDTTIVNRILGSIVRFPPDLTLGYVPIKSSKFRITIALLQSIKNILPLLVLEKVQTGLWANSYSNPSEMIKPIIQLIPYLLSLIVIFPLSAAGNRLDRNWEKFLAKDYQTFKINFRKKLPLGDQSFDLFNNKMDIINKIFFYFSFGTFSTGLIIDATFQFVLIFIGLLFFLSQGYLSATQVDINARVKIIIILENEVNDKSLN